MNEAVFFKIFFLKVQTNNIENNVTHINVEKEWLLKTLFSCFDTFNKHMLFSSNKICKKTFISAFDWNKLSLKC